MHLYNRRLLALTLLLVGLTTAFATHAQQAATEQPYIWGQTTNNIAGSTPDISGLTPNTDLDASLLASGQTSNAIATGALGPAIIVSARPAPGEKLFDDQPPREGGWKGLANVLEALSPGVDTSIPMTPSQVTDRIASMMNSGRYAEALDIIDQRTAQREAEMAIGSDVQLLFLRGRALAGLGRHNDAIEHYLNMTTLFPELPEPWNNLAVEYVKQGKLDMAQDALQMALSANPRYATAQANMGWVQLMQARQSFKNAQGVPGTSRAAEQTTDILGH